MFVSFKICLWSFEEGKKSIKSKKRTPVNPPINREGKQVEIHECNLRKKIKNATSAQILSDAYSIILFVSDTPTRLWASRSKQAYGWASHIVLWSFLKLPTVFFLFCFYFSVGFSFLLFLFFFPSFFYLFFHFNLFDLFKSRMFLKTANNFEICNFFEIANNFQIHELFSISSTYFNAFSRDDCCEWLLL